MDEIRDEERIVIGGERVGGYVTGEDGHRDPRPEAATCLRAISATTGRSITVARSCG
ncbi:MAG: hypothetical protein ACR2J5_17005 [Geodermatophilaceae bacterium]